jgi:hypothetical protein
MTRLDEFSPVGKIFNSGHLKNAQVVQTITGPLFRKENDKTGTGWATFWATFWAKF